MTWLISCPQSLSKSFDQVVPKVSCYTSPDFFILSGFHQIHNPVQDSFGRSACFGTCVLKWSTTALFHRLTSRNYLYPINLSKMFCRKWNCCLDCCLIFTKPGTLTLQTCVHILIWFRQQTGFRLNAIKLILTFFHNIVHNLFLSKCCECQNITI